MSIEKTIHLEEDVIRFSKQKWFREEIELAESLNMRWNGKEVYCPIKNISRISLWCFLKSSFANVVTSEKYEGVRRIIYSELAERYKEIDGSFLNKANDLAYFDELYKHQLDAIKLMCCRKHNLLAFEQGLGKSVTAISVSILMNIKKTLIVCPAICKWNWYEELVKWGIKPNEISLLDSKKDYLATDEKYIVINYDILKKKSKHFDDTIGHIILDECHYIKNTKSQRFGHIAKISSNTNAKLSLLTGTPIKNKVDDLFAYLRLINNSLGLSYQKFIDNFTFYYETSYGINIRKGRNLNRLYDMMSNFMIRYKKDECLDLPEKIIKKYYFELEDYKEEYNKALAHLLVTGKADTSSSIHTINIVTTKSKLKKICSLVEDLVFYKDKKVVVFTSYKEPFDYIVNHFKDRCVGIDGRISAINRRNAINTFKNDPECKVLVGNMIAAGVGINLVNSSDVIFCNMPFTSTDLEQCMDRLHRIGQTKDVNVYYTICRDTIDEHIFNLIEKKAGDISYLIDKGKTFSDYGNLPNELFKLLLNEEKKRKVLHS
tara:strand:+ start:5014 stop:6651 length:1638 start_codon:yes stop_codon:yes gene_type:complete